MCITAVSDEVGGCDGHRHCARRGEIKTLDVPFMDFFKDSSLPNADPRLRKATVRDVLTMRSGIEWHEQDRPLDDTNTTVPLEKSKDWIGFTLAQPMDSDPGTKWAYNSGGSMLLSGIIKAARPAGTSMSTPGSIYSSRSGSRTSTGRKGAHGASGYRGRARPEGARPREDRLAVSARWHVGGPLHPARGVVKDATTRHAKTTSSFTRATSSASFTPGASSEHERTKDTFGAFVDALLK